MKTLNEIGLQCSINKMLYDNEVCSVAYNHNIKIKFHQQIIGYSYKIINTDLLRCINL